MRTAIIAALLVLALDPAYAQRTTRSKLQTSPKPEPAVEAPGRDTIIVAPSDSIMPIALSGFEKTLRSRRESMLVTNRLDAPIEQFTVEITYTDMKGRMLHKRVLNIRCDIPPHETRKVDFPSWDKQTVWYYHLSSRPNTQSQATPFDIATSITRIITRP